MKTIVFCSNDENLIPQFKRHLIEFIYMTPNFKSSELIDYLNRFFDITDDRDTIYINKENYLKKEWHRRIY